MSKNVCEECRRPCLCGISGVHTHLADGWIYELCSKCRDDFLVRHRPVVNGEFVWRDTCYLNCGYCKLKSLTKGIV